MKNSAFRYAAAHAAHEFFRYLAGVGVRFEIIPKPDGIQPDCLRIFRKRHKIVWT